MINWVLIDNELAKFGISGLQQSKTKEIILTFSKNEENPPANWEVNNCKLVIRIKIGDRQALGCLVLDIQVWFLTQIYIYIYMTLKDADISCRDFDSNQQKMD